MTMADGDVYIAGFECISVPVDPGVSDSVPPTSERQYVPLQEATGSRAGYAYEAAGGAKMFNEGQGSIILLPQDGDLNAMDLQMAGVNEFFGISGRVCRCGAPSCI